MFRYGSEADQTPHKDYKSGGFLLVARGRTLETFKFRRAPGGGGRLIGYVKSVFMIHVGGTRCVPSSTDHIMKILARITLKVEIIRTCIFLF